MISHRIRLHKDLYPQVYDWDNLLLAYCKASKGTHRALDRAQQFARRHPFSRQFRAQRRTSSATPLWHPPE